MSESLPQNLLAWAVHLLMLCYYLPKVTRHVPPFLGIIWNGVLSTFAKLTPQSKAAASVELRDALKYLLNHERLPIIAAAIALNALGMAMSLAFPTFLYLDMTGTALAAFLLGPWYGAVVACISSGLVNYTLFPQLQTLPWMPVNVIGALFWGAVASTTWFRQPHHTSRPTISRKLILVCGVLAAFILAIPGSIVQLGLGDDYQDSFAFNKTIAASMKEFADQLSELMARFLPENKLNAFGFGSKWLSMSITNIIRYLPDKILTVLAAMLCIRMIFPVYWELLVRRRPDHARVFVLPRQPLLFVVIYVSIMVLHHIMTLSTSSANKSPTHTPAYSVMSLLLILGPLVIWLIGERGRAISDAEVRSTCSRAQIYQMITASVRQMPEDVRDNQRITIVFLVVACSAIGILLLLTIFAPYPDALRTTGSVFRELSALIVGVVFLLKLAQSAAIQQAAARDLITTSTGQSGSEAPADSVPPGMSLPGPGLLSETTQLPGRKPDVASPMGLHTNEGVPPSAPQE